MATDLRKQLVPGTRVRVTQQIAARNYSWASVIEGTIVSFNQKTTGSGYAHSRDGKLWLDRIVLRKTDGEISTLSLDDYSAIEVIAPRPGRRVSEQPPMMGSWDVDVVAARPFTIHGDSYLELIVQRGEQTAAFRVPSHAWKTPPTAGNRVRLTFLMGQVTQVELI